MAGQVSTEYQQNDTAAPYHHQSESFLDSEKVAVSLLITGILLGLIGVSITILGWNSYNVDPSYQWTQMLGPILISVGGTFILTSICRFGIDGCQSTLWNEDVFGMSGAAPTPTGQSFMINRISHPIVLSNATAVVCIPPHNFALQDFSHPSGPHPGGSMSDPPAFLPPQYDTVCSTGNTVLRAEDEDERRSQTTEGNCLEENASVSPPAYEDIYPSLNKDDQL